MRKIILPLLVMGVLFLSGCWDKVDLNDRAFVIAVGIDKYEEEANEKKDDEKTVPVHKISDNDLRYTVSLALPDLQSYAGTGGSDADTQAVKSAADSTIAGALGIIDSYASQKMYFGHLKIAILGNDIVSDSNLLRGTIDALERNIDISRKVALYVSDEKGVDILNADAPGEPLVGMFVSHYLKNNEESSALIFKQDLEGTVQQLRLSQNAIIPKISIDEGDIHLGGAAVIKDYELVGYLDDLETRGYLWVQGKGKGATVTTNYAEKPISLQITMSKRKIDFEEINNETICNIKVTVHGQIGEFYFGDGSLRDKAVLAEIEKNYKEVIQKEITSSLHKLQKEFKVDGCNFISLMEKKSNWLYKKYKDEKDGLYEKMKFNVSVDAVVSAAH